MPALLEGKPGNPKETKSISLRYTGKGKAHLKGSREPGRTCLQDGSKRIPKLTKTRDGGLSQRHRGLIEMSLHPALDLTKTTPENLGLQSDTTKKLFRRNNGFNI